MLYISQPSLSYQIQVIEEEIRFKIFDRTQKSISLTPAGKMFVENVRKIHSLYKEAVEEGQNIRKNLILFIQKRKIINLKSIIFLLIYIIVRTIRYAK